MTIINETIRKFIADMRTTEVHQRRAMSIETWRRLEGTRPIAARRVAAAGVSACRRDGVSPRRACGRYESVHRRRGASAERIRPCRSTCSVLK